LIAYPEKYSKSVWESCPTQLIDEQPAHVTETFRLGPMMLCFGRGPTLLNSTHRGGLSAPSPQTLPGRKATRRLSLEKLLPCAGRTSISSPLSTSTGVDWRLRSGSWNTTTRHNTLSKGVLVGSFRRPPLFWRWKHCPVSRRPWAPTFVSAQCPLARHTAWRDFWRCLVAIGFRNLEPTSRELNSDRRGTT